jgi:hypothetical protein
MKALKHPYYLALAALALIPATNLQARFTVDLGQDMGPATQRASGFLWGITATEPSDDLLFSLKPRLYRSRVTPWGEGTGIPAMQRMALFGARIQVVLSDEYALQFPGRTIYRMTNEDFGYPSIRKWPGDDGDFDLWERVIQYNFDRIEAAGLEVEWDVWEEPNYKGWWGASKRQFFETWKRAHQKLRSLDPDARIVGPSINRFDPDYLEAFLLFAKEHDVLPDVLSWHEIIVEHSPASIPTHTAKIRAFMEANDIEIEEIDINEYVSHDRMTDPGMHAWYLANLDKAGVTGAAKATWLETDTGIYNATTPSLGGLLTHDDLQPRATWWVFRAYADITGRIVASEGDRSINGLAGIDEDAKKLRMLMGRTGHSWPDPFVEIQGLDQFPWLTESGKVLVRASRIPVTGWQALPMPPGGSTQIPVKSDTLILDMSTVGLNEAVIIEISPAPAQ